MRTTLLTLLVAAALAAAALIAVGGTLDGSPRWTPDGLFYQSRALELQGATQQEALRQTFGGPIGAEMRRIDPTHSGDPSWVEFNAQFYERRIAVPAAAAALEPISGERAVLDISLVGYVAAILALFGLLLLRFKLPIAAAVSFATVFLPALVDHSSYPLTDSWGLALEILALASGLLVLDRGPRWLIPWTLSILVLSFTRDSTWVPLLAAAWLSLTLRSRLSFAMLGTAIAAVVPVLLLFPMPMRELLAQMLNGAIPVADPSWGFIAENYPGALIDLLQADGGFVRDGAWFSAAYFIGGLTLLFLFSRGAQSAPSTTFLKAGAVAGLASVLAIPVFSAFRLELVWVPMAAFGLALGLERLAARVVAPRLVREPGIVSTPRGA
jgi:hypothetical protein